MREEVNLIDYGRIVARRKWPIVLFVAVVTASAALISLFRPNIYKAEVTLMTIGGGASAGGLSTIVTQLMGGLGSLPVGPSSSGRIIAILKSRTLAERMVEKHDLIRRLHPHEKPEGFPDLPDLEDAAGELLSIVSVEENLKSNLIVLRGEWTDPKLIAEILNHYVHELGEYISQNALTSAKRNRVFIERQLERNSADLLEAGKEISFFYSANKISNVVPTLDVPVSLSGPQAAETGVADELRQKVDRLGEDLKRMRFVKNVPQQVYLQYLTLRRELLGQLNALLTNQYELAKIEEAKEELAFQVIDPARAPKKKFKPKRRQIVLMAFAASLFLAACFSIFWDYLEKEKRA